MGKLGFSTGALAHGDFMSAFELLDEHDLPAIEVSVLRLPELYTLIEKLDAVEARASQYAYVSYHAPSHVKGMSDGELVDRLRPIWERGRPMIVHADTITDVAPWRDLGHLLLIENMDSRKKYGKSPGQLRSLMDDLPGARLCFDIGHARQIDRTMALAYEFIEDFGGRIAEIHLSEVTPGGKHVAMSWASVQAYQPILRAVGAEIPVIIESEVDAAGIDKEIRTAQIALSREDRAAVA